MSDTTERQFSKIKRTTHEKMRSLIKIETIFKKNQQKFWR